MKLPLPAALLTLCLLFCRLPGTAQSAGTTTPYSLQRCVALALEHNLQVRQAGWLTETDRANLTAAWGDILPFLSGNVTHGINQGRSIDPFTNTYINQEISFANYNLNGSVTLWNGLSLQNAVHQSKLAYEADKMDLQQVRENVTISVMLAYLQVLNSDEQLNQARQQAAVTARQVERLQELDSLGAIAPALLHDLRGQLANDRLNEVNMRNNAQTARLTLAQLMNTPFSAAMQVEPLPETLPPATSSPDAARLYEAAAAALPQIKAADLRLRSAQKGLKAARGQWSPSIYAFGNLGTTYSSAASRSTLLGTTEVATGNYVVVGTDRVPVYTSVSNYSSQVIPYNEQWRNNVFSTIGLGLRIPILNGNQTRTRIGLARIAEQQAAFQAQTTRTQVQQVVEQAVLNLQNARERYNTLTGQVHDFALSFQAAEARFEAGVGTSVDYMVAKTNLDRARSNLIAARYDVALRSKIVEYYEGKPLP